MTDAALFDMQPEFVIGRNAGISDCGRYRYWLTRTWNLNEPSAVFIMLNPSMADASRDDPTIRRCIRFAADWDYGGIVVANLYAYRATKPADLWQTDDPVGPENDDWLLNYLADGALVVAAWGGNAKPKRVNALWRMSLVAGRELHCLGTTKDGAPRHPLYVRGGTKPQPWENA